MTETTLSRGHRWFIKLLEKHHITHEVEAPFGKRSVDIYLPEWHMAIEIDGPFHTPKGDAERDTELLVSYGLLTYRLKLQAGWKARAAEFLRESIEHAHVSAAQRKEIWYGRD